MLDVRRLVLLREVAIRGTLAAAAEALAYSPSAVSQQLAVLERETGAVLLRKVGRRVQLTPQAEILVEAAGEVLTLLERAEAALAASGESVTGRVRVAVFQSAALALMPGALRAVAKRFPEVRVEMVQREPEGALHETSWAREFDLVVAEQYPGHSTSWLPGLVRTELMADAIRLAVSSESAVTGLAEAANEAWVMEPPGTASRHFAEQICRIAGFEPDVRFETADLQAQIRLAASGHAVALMPDLVWAGADPDCRLLDLPGLPCRTIFTAQREAQLVSPAVQVFRECLAEVAGGYS
ncbi:LysR family transcriptional regulator [Rathayibacter toxicus]|uniref:LysR family transcriptional regulator n=1 Tax=Rathayibacter toxicus TaxID=145458 RepID=A0A0C5B8E9_9MICO|nr:LysR family transcriptional regulator [Rathayibacter toxicus]AJM77018.1 LysR family transcriptional regulator [Rathayibacter toxicus]ALS57178.1 LysR family transcriptional regulator [Rathayibacter toxicus]KKM46018.1 LysR family transcriptional regulator [Rathayibacter toxicus]PPG22948.1 LysR family transcriptional regulator [Rathayibacter toxicus]PPG47529.1 LysR family transcriptional regulator [Rathayibacter toxicus]